MQPENCERVLDFRRFGMWWNITHSTADTQGERLEAINVLAPGFGGPPLHLHPDAEETYTVLSGTLDVCVDGQWSKLGPGEMVTVPAQTPHTLKNEGQEEVRLINVHKPALDFERFFRRLHALDCSGKVQLPPKDLRSAILVSMLFTEHAPEVVSVKPPPVLMRVLAMVGKLLGYQLPA